MQIFILEEKTPKKTVAETQNKTQKMRRNSVYYNEIQINNKDRTTRTIKRNDQYISHII